MARRLPGRLTYSRQVWTLIAIGAGLLAPAAVWAMVTRGGLGGQPRGHLDALSESRMLASGTAEGDRCHLRGVVAYADEWLPAPLSGRKCCYYAARIEVPEDKLAWKNAVREVQGCSFILRTADEELLVGADDADVVLVKDFLKYEIRDLNTASAAEFLQRHRELYRGHDELRFLEGVLEEGEEVVVAGYISQDADPGGQAGYREVVRRRVIRGGYGAPLRITDDPRALD